jgi:alkanesulfonate monooxygenase SsuD/methylene tetrahydromethanopterin reductase-like flavin-dependent oxidoreductase (luciferase family)
MKTRLFTRIPGMAVAGLLPLMVVGGLGLGATANARKCVTARASPRRSRDVFETADRAEAWGIDCVWLGEIHFTPTRSVISASLQVASAIAARTRRLRVGTAVQVLPLNHPLRIAEEVATVDHISEGRFEFGIGRSGVVRSYDTYGVPYGQH